jgi:hypothetical protein
MRFITITESSDASHAYAGQTSKPPEKCEDVSVSSGIPEDHKPDLCHDMKHQCQIGTAFMVCSMSPGERSGNAKF